MFKNLNHLRENNKNTKKAILCDMYFHQKKCQLYLQLRYTHLKRVRLLMSSKQRSKNAFRIIAKE